MITFGKGKENDCPAKKAETAGVEETTSVNVPNMLFAFNKGIKSGKAKNENEAS